VVNVPGADLVKSLAVIADDIPESKSEIDEAGLTLKQGIAVKTPAIAECQAAIEFTFDKEVPVGHHAFLIGKVAGGWIRQEILDSDGRINIFKARVMKDFKYPKPLYVVPGDVIEG
jgi:flavin reductase (DIM6/NTAB) family NADH-FMN oxidoreductase RutF